MVTQKPSRRPAKKLAARGGKSRRLKPLGQIIADLTKDISPEERDAMPRDGAANHDHYIYGTPKQY